MIFEIIMNNPGRYKYMSKNKDTVSVCLIDLGGETYKKINRYSILDLWQRKKPHPSMI